MMRPPAGMRWASWDWDGMRQPYPCPMSVIWRFESHSGSQTTHWLPSHSIFKLTSKHVLQVLCRDRGSSAAMQPAGDGAWRQPPRRNSHELPGDATQPFALRYRLRRAPLAAAMDVFGLVSKGRPYKSAVTNPLLGGGREQVLVAPAAGGTSGRDRGIAGGWSRTHFPVSTQLCTLPSGARLPHSSLLTPLAQPGEAAKPRQ